MELGLAQNAMLLVQQGRVQEGIDTMRSGQVRGEAPCFVLEGLWLLEGRVVVRDLLAARAAFRNAAALGHNSAARTYSAMLACGIGGDPDWSAALGVLLDWWERDPIAARQLELLEKMAIDEDGLPTERFDLKPISADPSIAMVDGLFTPEECAFLIDIGEPKMERAKIFDEQANRFVIDDIRRSFRVGFPIISEWPFIRALNLRIAAATDTDVRCGEPLQVLRYGPTDEYRPHDDALPGMDNPRVKTALVWLNDGYRGGETDFPEIGERVKGKVGDLVTFTNTLADGSPDPRMRHAGLQVTSGVKFLASRWIRERPSGPEGFGQHEFERASAPA
jgi:prolyl 4-hydroxylase